MVTISVTYDERDFGPYIKNQLLRILKKSARPESTIDGNTCTFGQLWVNINGRWIIYSNEAFYDNLSRFIETVENRQGR